MPLKFWDEAFLTATYLINRMPSKVIHDQTPFEHLHRPPRLFTFTCFWLRLLAKFASL
jgi:hypothetical protein